MYLNSIEYGRHIFDIGLIDVGFCREMLYDEFRKMYLHLNKWTTT